ncbi:MAG TPA: hypothetical protein P5205_00920 [Candidatus Paceibacterota bacterium]|nr:hypothetical protein [Verrucomicrobiota bacterium]HSA08913.1 hypothetical protein [Candidatus Paceibacterota bacterium]
MSIVSSEERKRADPDPLAGVNTRCDLRHNWWKLAACGLVMAALAVIGYWRIFTQFMAYDDEGCFLWSLSNYCSEGGLYDRVESWYGPFFFTFNHLLHALAGLNFDHDTGRLLTLFYWCGTALVCGLFSWKQTRSVGAGLAGTALTFVSLITVIREPMHPSGFLALAVALAVLVGGAAIVRGRPVVFGGMVALLGTAMVLSKINVGAFFLIAAGTWFAINSRALGSTRAASLLCALACVVVPLLLMRDQWPSPWATGYVLVFACGALALTAALHAARQPEHGLRSGMVGLAGALVLGGVVLVAASAHGTSWAGLWKGVVVAPKGFAQGHYVQLLWPAGARELAVFQLAAAAAYYFRERAAWVSPAIAALRIVAGLWFFARVPLLFSEATSLQNFCFNYGPSLAWLMAVPLASSIPGTADRARLWLAWVFIWQTLQAYPVPGSQVGWGCFLWVPLFVVGWHEAVSYWVERYWAKVRVARVAAGFVLVGAAVLALLPIGRVGYENFTSNEPLDLPGSSRLRLARDLSSDLRIVQQNIRAHGGLLYTYPLMRSLNLWTGHRSPFLPRETLEAYEHALFEQFEADPRAVFVVNLHWIELTRIQGKPQPENIFRYVNAHFVPALQVDTFQFWVRRDRPVAPFSIAQLLPGSAEERRQLESAVEALARPLAAIEFVRLTPEHTVLQRLPLDAAQPWQRVSINESGAPVSRVDEGTGPVNISQASRLRLELAPVLPWPSLAQVEVRLLDADDRILGRLRFASKLAYLPVTEGEQARPGK